VIAGGMIWLDSRRHKHLAAVDILLVVSARKAVPNPAQANLAILDF
jgi:hypothetical protein